MQVLLMGDTHFSGDIPVGRLDKDTFVQTQENKLNEIIGIANDYDISIICPGDLFNSSNATYGIYNRISRILNRLNNPLYFTFGNHDLLYHSKQQWKQTALGALWTSHKNVKHISEYKDTIWSYRDWNESIRNKLNSNHYLSHQAIVSQKQMNNNIWIARDERGFAIPFLDKKLLKYKLMVCGHWHKRYVIRDDSNRLLINPGPVVRRDATVDSLNDMPSVTLLDLDPEKSKGKEYKHIFLKSAKPGDQILSRNHIQERQITSGNNKKIIQFINHLQTEQKDTSSRYMTMLLKALNSNELNKNIKVLISKWLSEIKSENKE